MMMRYRVARGFVIIMRRNIRMSEIRMSIDMAIIINAKFLRRRLTMRDNWRSDDAQYQANTQQESMANAKHGNGIAGAV